MDVITERKIREATKAFLAMKKRGGIAHLGRISGLSRETVRKIRDNEVVEPESLRKVEIAIRLEEADKDRREAIQEEVARFKGMEAENSRETEKTLGGSAEPTREIATIPPYVLDTLRFVHAMNPDALSYIGEVAGIGPYRCQSILRGFPVSISDLATVIHALKSNPQVTRILEEQQRLHDKFQDAAGFRDGEYWRSVFSGLEISEKYLGNLRPWKDPRDERIFSFFDSDIPTKQEFMDLLEVARYVNGKQTDEIYVDTSRLEALLEESEELERRFFDLFCSDWGKMKKDIYESYRKALGVSEEKGIDAIVKQFKEEKKQAKAVPAHEPTNYDPNDLL